MLPFSSNPTGVGRSGLAVEPCQSQPGGGEAVSISAWRRGSWLGGGGAVSNLGFFFIFFYFLVLKLWNLTLFGC